MGENQQEIVPNQEQVVSAPSESAEKSLSQSEVNDLIGTAKQKGYHKGYQQALTELNGQGNAVNTGLPEDKVRQAVADEFARQQKQFMEQQLKAQQEAEGKRILSEVAAKVNADKQKYPDFDEVTSQVDFSQVPQVVHYANLVDNAGDIFYDLAKNPSKIATLLALPPQLAAVEVKRLSNSIKKNQSAVSQPNAPAPLDQVKPSNIGIDSGSKTVADFKKIFHG